MQKDFTPSTRTSDNSLTSKVRNPASGLIYLLVPAVCLLALWWGADSLLVMQQNHVTLNVTTTSNAANIATQPNSEQIILKADQQGHFRGIVIINNISMPFMIDTGATKTAIPYKLAIAARLPIGNAIITHTAGGQVTDQLTKINSFKLGNAEIKNLDAIINRSLDEVLIGMNTLKLFNMGQSGNILTLTPNLNIKSPATFASNNTAEIQAENPVKKPFTLKKTVICDQYKVCKTSFSDH